MKYSTPGGQTTETRPRVFGKTTVICGCGFNKTVATAAADGLANTHAGSCRRGTPDRRFASAAGANGRR
ncbi:hypothetical protein [Streptomyces sp. NBC_00932]|uniref:hypothetical protein n=1 Tax=Streptomyces sp. NBC_00932 TaxID=2903690 RepID=UPI00386D0A9D|nr:hypothetical protein OG221_27755 [Streptomyces sp. NBC_00932]